jgi:hypothetical protein
MPKLFSYGDLQRDDVQRSTLGRLVSGRTDELVGWVLGYVPIEDPAVVAATGKTHHNDVRFDGHDGSRVLGSVLDVTESELARIDEFEARFAYHRVPARLASGGEAWVYVHRPSSSPWTRTIVRGC